MAENDIPRFPDRSMTSQGLLYTPLQDIEIYVEDADLESFYYELLSRLVGSETKIKKVFALGGREQVLKTCVSYSGKNPTLFIIDGDLSWVAGEPTPTLERLFIHPCYCVENYLFCEQAMTELIVESTGRLAITEAKRMLDWQAIRLIHQRPLVDLFIEFAVAHVLYPSLQTVSNGFGTVCTQVTKKGPPILDTAKVKKLIDNTRSAVVAQKGIRVYQKKRKAVCKRVSLLTDPFDSISGKAYLIPIQMHVVKRFTAQNITRSSFIFRLARHCNLRKLQPLKEALLSQVAIRNV